MTEPVTADLQPAHEPDTGFTSLVTDRLTIRRFATEAVTALLGYLVHTRGNHRVTAACDARNRGSVALLERIGVRREAHHLASEWCKGEWTDELVYAVLADEWSARRAVSDP